MVRKKTEPGDANKNADVAVPKRSTASKKKVGKVSDALVNVEGLDHKIADAVSNVAKVNDPRSVARSDAKDVKRKSAPSPKLEEVSCGTTAPLIGEDNNFQRHKELLAAIVEYSSDAIIGLSPNGSVLSWNKGARDLFRIEDQEAIGQNISSIISSKESLVPLSGWSASDIFEHTFTRRDGQALDLSIKIYPIDDAGNGTVYGAAIIRDITDQKQAEKELLLMSQQLVETNKQLEEYAWVAAHDLKEPLRTMGTYAKLVHDEYLGKLDDDGRQMLSIIYGSATSALSRIDDTLRYSSLSKTSFNAEKVNLSQVVKAVVVDLTRAITECGANITVAKLPIVIGNPEMLAVLFQNLISNAIKFRRKVSPEIRIHSKISTTMAVITIQDNGIGIDNADFEIIFGMFKRLDGSYPGTGLGLSIAKRIVDLHKGKIWVTSEAGKGTTFHVQLPTS